MNLTELWQALTRPGGQDLLIRLKWVGILTLVVIAAGIWIGQQVLAASPAYYPRGRFTLALCWSLLVLALMLAMLLAVGWWIGGVMAWVGLAVHLSVIALALVTVAVLMPSRSAIKKRP